MKHLKNIILFFVLVVFISLQAQNKEKKITLNKVKISNLELDEILSKAIEAEKECSYYNSDLIFTINVNKKGVGSETLTVLIETQNDKDIILGLKPNAYFYKDGHLFIVDGNSYPNLFSPCNETKDFDYTVYDSRIQNPEEEVVIVHYFPDDSFTQWEWEYKEGMFSLVQSHPLCSEREK